MTFESFRKEPITDDEADNYFCPCGKNCGHYCIYESEIESFWDVSNLQDVTFKFDDFGYVRVSYEFFTKSFDMTCLELHNILNGLAECVTDKELLSLFGVDHYNVGFSHRAYIVNMCMDLEFRSILPKVKTYFDSIGFEFRYFMDTATLNFLDGRVLNFKINNLEKVFKFGIWDLAIIMVGNINAIDMYGYLKGYAIED